MFSKGGLLYGGGYVDFIGHLGVIIRACAFSKTPLIRGANIASAVTAFSGAKRVPKFLSGGNVT